MKSSNYSDVILYTDKHPNIKKILRDDDYWLAPHEITGENFAVFSVRPEKGRYESSKSSPGVMSMMFRIWKEPRENQKLIDLFEIENTSILPLLLLLLKSMENTYLSNLKSTTAMKQTPTIQQKNILNLRAK